LLTLSAYQPSGLLGFFRHLAVTWISHLGNGFSLRCIQRLSNTIVATQQCAWRQQLAHQGMAHLGPLVLETNSLKNPTLTADRDQPVLRIRLHIFLCELDYNFIRSGWLTFSLYGRLILHQTSLGIVRSGFHRNKLTFT